MKPLPPPKPRKRKSPPKTPTQASKHFKSSDEPTIEETLALVNEQTFSSISDKEKESGKFVYAKRVSEHRTDKKVVHAKATRKRNLSGLQIQLSFALRKLRITSTLNFGRGLYLTAKALT